MPQIPKQHDAASKDPSPLLTYVIRGLSGVYTAAPRNAIPDDKLYNLENIIPIGQQNAQVVPNLSTIQFDWSANPNLGVPYYGQYFSLQYSSLNELDQIFFLTSKGYVCIFSQGFPGNVSVLNIGSPLSGSGSRMAQWSNSVVLIIDSTGLYAFSTTPTQTFTKIVGPGVPTSGQEIAVFASRVWITQNRILFNSGAADYTAASWLPENGAGFNILIDPTLRSGRITRMVPSNGLLYLFAPSSINVISNVVVPIGAIPPTPVYSNQNVQPLIGTDQPFAIAPFDQSLLMANKYGGYRVYGLSAPKISDDLNGTWQYLDLTQPMSAGQVIVNGILCGAMLLTRKGAPDFSDGPILAMWYRKDNEDIWWFANYGAVSLIIPVIENGVASLYALISNRLFKLFADNTSAPATLVQTKLYPLEDDLQQKEAIRAGFLARYSVFGNSMSLSIDGLNVSQITDMTASFSSGLWIDDGGDQAQGLWIDDGGLNVTGGWIDQGFQLISGRAYPMFSHNIGLTLKTTGYQYTLNLLAFDYKLRDRWT